MGENISISNIKGFISRICKELTKLIIKNKQYPEKMGEIFEQTLHHGRYMKRFSTSLIIKEMKIETMRFQWTLSEYLKLKE